MLWRYVKTQAFVLLCGGLVGPIFLGTYFALGRDDLIKWMYYVGLLITAADVLIALALTSFGAKSAATSAALEQSGVLALARITAVTDTATRINERPVVKLQLHISGTGFEPFDGQDRVITGVARLGNINARQLVVLVDPATRRYQIDWDRSALVNGLVPAEFTVAEDDKTYDLTGQTGPLMEILQILKANNIPVNRMVDVRSDPAVRQQIHSVVQRAVQQAQAASAAVGQPASASAAVGAQPEQSVAERLQELETLHHNGVLSEQEYTAKRAQIIAEI